MMHTRSITLGVLSAFGLAACSGAATVVPPEEDSEPFNDASAALVGYAGTDAVATEGRSRQTNDVVAGGALYGFGVRLDLDLFDRSDVPGSALAPPALPGCAATVTPANLTVADFVAVANADANLVLQLPNRSLEGEPVGTESSSRTSNARSALRAPSASSRSVTTSSSRRAGTWPASA